MKLTKDELRGKIFLCGSCGRSCRGQDLIVWDLDPRRGAGPPRTVTDPAFDHISTFDTNGLRCRCLGADPILVKEL